MSRTRAGSEPVNDHSKSKHQGWLEISIQVDPVAHDALSAFLFDLGCEGLVTDNFGEQGIKAYVSLKDIPRDHPTLPERVSDLGNRIDAFLLSLRAIFPEIPPAQMSLQQIENQDWHQSWRRFFHPDQITPNLMIVPAWESVPLAFDGVVIRMDPGPAFGSGQHPTTRMCLEAMEHAALPALWTMLDVGTGSGILAIYGARLGAGRIVGLDIDPEAIRWAERNIDLNGLSGSIELSSRPLEQWEDRFSMIVANLTLQPILNLLPHFLRVLESPGTVIISGILEDQVDQVEDLLAHHASHDVQILHRDEWACFIVRKG